MLCWHVVCLGRPASFYLLKKTKQTKPAQAFSSNWSIPILTFMFLLPVIRVTMMMVMIIIYIHVLIETWNLRLKAKFGKTKAINNATTTSANNTTTNKNDNNSKWCWTGIHTCSFMRNYVLFILKAKWVTILEKLAFSNRRGQLECDFSFLHSARLVLIFQSNADRLTMSPCRQPQLQQKVRRY